MTPPGMGLFSRPRLGTGARLTRVRRGLDLPLQGAAPEAAPVDRLDVQTVALLPPEFRGMKAKILVEVGSEVSIGSPLFCDRRDVDVVYTSPANGRVSAIHRGERRAVLAVVVEAESFAQSEPLETLDFDRLDRAAVRSLLLRSGLWPSLRRRPYDRVALSDEVPRAIVVQAHDSHPLAPDRRRCVEGREAELQLGLTALTHLTEGRVVFAAKAGSDWSDSLPAGVSLHEFSGPHPSGTAGFAIHTIAPAGAQQTTWYIDVVDVADIGRLCSQGLLPTTRIVALTGPGMRSPKLVRTRPGADLESLLRDELLPEEPRVINGSALWGDLASPGTPAGFLGRYTRQVTALPDDVGRELLGWAVPSSERFSAIGALGRLLPGKAKRFDTDVNGSLRAIVPIGAYESVVPFDILPTQLIKALASGDIEGAEQLGLLELAEEDLALCQFVDPCKVPITEWLRNMLTLHEKEG